MGNMIKNFMSKLSRSKEEILDDIILINFGKVYASIVGYPHVDDPKWVLIDTGMENSQDFIIDLVYKRYNMDLPPQAIILTHGHSDNIGSALSLARHWDVPIFVHLLELPYVTGQLAYPTNHEEDVSISRINLKNHVLPLPKDGNLPYMPEWRYIHTPGHTPGHISIFRENDRTLIVGDAFTSLPKYQTEDFKLAKESINKLKTLKPNLAVRSHDKPLQGQELTKYLDILLKN